MLGGLDHYQTVQIASLLAQGAEPQDISEQFEVPLELVKLVGARNGSVSDEDISEDELKLLRRHALALATSSENERVQADMTKFLIERARPAKVNQPVNIIAQINQVLTQGNQRLNDMMRTYSEEADGQTS